MHSEATPSPVTVSKNGVCVVDGYGIRVRVDRGHLTIADGIGPSRRESGFSRATCPIKRLVLLGHTGFVTLEALAWMADVGVAFVQLHPDGRLLATSAGYGLDDPRLRRAQAAAWGTEVGVGVARDLLRQKIDGQAEVAERLPDSGAVPDRIRRLISELDGAKDAENLMVVEAAAASEYWSAWANVAMPWAARHLDRVPEHWRSFGGRASPLTGNPRLAANPGNALLNYAYAVLEAEARLSCLSAGLDPGLGVLHADLKARDSLALDVMEAVRPDVDRFVLALLSTQTLRADDFVESRRGICRLLAPMSHRLVETLPVWRRYLAPVVEPVAAAFADAAGSRIGSLPTKLTQTKRSAGRKRLWPANRPTTRPNAERGRPRCRGCGIDVSEHQRWCNACRRDELARRGNSALEGARARRMQLRAEGRDPATSAAAKARQREARLIRAAELRAIVSIEPPPDVSVFRDRILPALEKIPLSALAEATGLSTTYCSKIRQGLLVPHPRWWDALSRAAGARE